MDNNYEITCYRLLSDYIKTKYNISATFYSNSSGRDLVMYENIDNGKVITKYQFNEITQMQFNEAKIKIDELLSNG